MRTTISRKVMTVSALIVLTALVAGCTEASPTTIHFVTGGNPATDVVALATGATDADLHAAIMAAIAQLPELAQDAFDTSGVPGLSIAVVYRGETIYTGGFSVKKIGEKGAIDPETVFQIASISKSISATTIAKAITDKAIDWDTPVIEELPDFTMGDDVVTKRATAADYFSHRSGLSTSAGDDLEDIGYDRAFILERLHLQPLQPFRSSYNYSNYGITVGAEAAAALGMT